jgi:MYXO-CTERM domain-containing protein
VRATFAKKELQMKLSKFGAAALLAATVMGVAPQVTWATVVTDPTNDFIASFTGAHSGDLDVLSVSATFDGVTFHLGATMNGNIGTLASSLYVFGFNRGAASSNFAAIGLPGVVFDAVITVTGSGVTGGRDLVAATAIVLPANAFQVSGSHFDLDIPASLLPSRGLGFNDYGINLWTRDASQAGNAAIADFAPNATNFTVAEPQSAALALLGLGAATMVRRRAARSGAPVRSRG